MVPSRCGCSLYIGTVPTRLRYNRRGKFEASINVRDSWHSDYRGARPARSMADQCLAAGDQDQEAFAGTFWLGRYFVAGESVRCRRTVHVAALELFAADCRFRNWPCASDERNLFTVEQT